MWKRTYCSIIEAMINLQKIRYDFPILSREVHPGKQLVYLDSGATSQKPITVIESMNAFYRQSNANTHRGIHVLAEEATALYEQSRLRIANFIGARSPRQIVFTRNTTESINLVAHAWARKFLNAGDLILLSEMEHHSNIVPWFMLAKEKGIRIEYIPITSQFLLDMEKYQQLLQKGPKLVAMTHMSNVLGTINPIKVMTDLAHRAGSLMLVDGAQSVPHFPVDVNFLEVDFMAFSAHKMCGPTGIGVLYAQETLLEKMDPFLGGGDMIKKVTFEGFIPNEIPYKFEAGTPAIAEVIGFGAAIDYLNSIGMSAIAEHEKELTRYALEVLSNLKWVQVLGPALEYKGGVISFTIDGIHPHDVAQVLDGEGIAIRAGHHCAMPLHQKLGISASSRASLYLYNTREEIDKLVIGLNKVKQIFS
jgi:cysteine desulfurase / selenocysteine lyase